jgi:hypothetical protein
VLGQGGQYVLWSSLQFNQATAQSAKTPRQIVQGIGKPLPAMPADSRKTPVGHRVNRGIVTVDGQYMRGHRIRLGESGVISQPKVATKPINDRAHAGPFLDRRQRSEQYFTSSHTFSHFFRHAKGKPQ